jgi:KDO2-lipid IV(A) lauroyltransferase
MRYAIRYRKKVIEENLAFAFPEKSEAERKKIRNKFYRNFTDSFAETIKLLSLSKKEIKKRLIVVNKHYLDQEVLSGHSAIFTAGHLFNWELEIVGISLDHHIKVETVYLKVNNSFFNNLMLKIRTRFGGVLTEKQDFRKSMFTLRNSPRIVQLASDQRPASSEKRYKRDFLNRPAVFFEGAELLSKKMNLPVFFGTITKIKRGHYHLLISKIAEPPYDQTQAHSITDAYCQKLEENIRIQPDIYLWSHKRWKIS